MTEQVEQSANDTVISEILELNPELEGIGNYEYGWTDSDEAGQIFLTSISITSNTSCVLPKVRLSLGKSFLKIFA